MLCGWVGLERSIRDPRQIVGPPRSEQSWERQRCSWCFSCSRRPTAPNDHRFMFGFGASDPFAISCPSPKPAPQRAVIGPGRHRSPATSVGRSRRRPSSTVNRIVCAKPRRSASRRSRRRTRRPPSAPHTSCIAVLAVTDAGGWAHPYGRAATQHRRAGTPSPWCPAPRS